MHVQNITNYYIKLVLTFYFCILLACPRCVPLHSHHGMHPFAHNLEQVKIYLLILSQPCWPGFFLYVINTSSSAIPQIPLCRMMLGLNSELFCSQTTWINLILIFLHKKFQFLICRKSAPTSNFGVLCRRSFTDSAVCIKKTSAISIEHTGLLYNLIHKYLCWRVNLLHLSLFYPLFLFASRKLIIKLCSFLH
jgi:hypothetical protein